ncbi:signal-regulatory protein beta-2-like [Poecilia latipinna]|uniref:signal-regulatory protein beta-2-like n=1 Tax=Poecilia latipinna TaxID=48699 RepID=UPI00072E6150|nr:PREDICTED: signal-regulatory protein beta-2-like [Poecilia latipinna]
MTLLWLTTLLLLHQGYSLVPVITVELGQSVTLTCAFSLKYQNNKWIFWYKQSAGDTLDLIVMQQGTTNPNYGPAFSASKFSVTNYSSLTIFTTVQQDEGMYHCAQMEALDFMWSGTYVSIKGITERTSNYIVISQPTISEPTGSETLQCSVLSDSENTTCSGEPSAFWFRARSEKYFPDMIYAEGKKAENCEKRSDSPKRCFYNFSKNISSSDTGTYYCAVATCGQIIFGNEINRRNGKTNENNMLVVTICLVTSVFGNIVFICYLTRRSACQQCKGLFQ